MLIMCNRLILFQYRRLTSVCFGPKGPPPKGPGWGDPPGGGTLPPKGGGGGPPKGSGTLPQNSPSDASRILKLYEVVNEEKV